MTDQPASTVRASPAADTTGSDDDRKAKLAEARGYLGMGLGVGVIGVASAAVLGATCPVCVVAAPALIGYGALKRWQARRK